MESTVGVDVYGYNPFHLKRNDKGLRSFWITLQNLNTTLVQLSFFNEEKTKNLYGYPLKVKYVTA